MGEKMTEIEKIKDDLYIQRSKLSGWKIVYPIKKDLDKPYTLDNIHWKNLLTGGGWFKLLVTIFIFAIIIFSVWAYLNDTKICRELISNSCVQEKISECKQFNFSNFSLGEGGVNGIQNNYGEYIGYNNKQT